MTTTQPPAEQHPRRGRRWWLVLVAIVAIGVLGAAGGTWLWAGNHDHSTDSRATSTTTQPSTTTTATATSTTATPSTTSTTQVDGSAMWPAPGSTTRFSSAGQAARSFAVEFLGFRDPVIGELQQGDARSGEIPVRPRATGPVTTVLVRQLGTAGDWSVLGAVTADITVDSPAAMTAVSSPLRVTGRALAFEGTVQVQVREDGRPGAIGSTFVTGGGDVPRPFSGSVTFERPRSHFGALVLFTRSAENGEVWQASALRVELP